MAAVAAAVACGGASKPDSTAPLESARDSQKHEVHTGEGGHMGHAGGSGEAGEMAGMPPTVAKFHAALAPRWHAKQGPQRMTDTCAAIGELHGDADAIVAAPVPDGGDAAAWSAGAKQLAEAVTVLDGACKASDAAGFETAFAQVHERFHGLTAAAGGEHDRDGHDGHGDHP